MITTVDFQQQLFQELINIVTSELGITFTPQELNIIQLYMRNNPNADPKQVLAQIISVAEKKLQKSLSAEKIKRIKQRCEILKIITPPEVRRWKIFATPKQPPSKKLTDKEIKRIIDEAEKKVIGSKKNAKKLTDKEKQKASEYFVKNIKDEDNPVVKANIALLGVIVVGVAGGIRPVVLQNWGNLLNAPDMNPYHGMSTIDQANRIDFSLGGDPLGVECAAILNVIRAGNIDPKVAASLEGNLKEQSTQEQTQQEAKQQKSYIPKLTPPGSDIDDFG